MTLNKVEIQFHCIEFNHSIIFQQVRILRSGSFAAQLLLEHDAAGPLLHWTVENFGENTSSTLFLIVSLLVSNWFEVVELLQGSASSASFNVGENFLFRSVSSIYFAKKGEFINGQE